MKAEYGLLFPFFSMKNWRVECIERKIKEERRTTWMVGDFKKYMNKHSTYLRLEAITKANTLPTFCTNAKFDPY